MTIKSKERILKEIQTSLKLTENRVAKSQAISIWQPVNHKPKVALCNTHRIQGKPTETDKAPKVPDNIRPVNEIPIKQMLTAKEIQETSDVFGNPQRVLEKSTETQEAQKAIENIQPVNEIQIKVSSKAKPNEQTSAIIKKMGKTNKNKKNFKSANSRKNLEKTQKNKIKKNKLNFPDGPIEKKILMIELTEKQICIKTSNTVISTKKGNVKSTVNSKQSLENNQNAGIAKAAKRKAQTIPQICNGSNKQRKFDLGSKGKGQLKSASNGDKIPSKAIIKSKKIMYKKVNGIKKKKYSLQKNVKPTELIEMENNFAAESGEAESSDEEEAESLDEKEAQSSDEEEAESSDEGEADSSDNEEADSSDDEEADSSDNEEADSSDEEEAESGDNASESEYSLDSDKGFFTKPKVLTSNETAQVSLGWENGKDAKDSFLMQLPQTQAEITKVLVFDGMLTEDELESETSDEESAEEEDSTDANSESADDQEEQQMEVSDSGADKDMEKQESMNASLVDNEEEIEEQLQQNPEIENQDMNEHLQNEVNMYGFLPELSIFENSFKTNNVLAVLKQDIELYGTITLTLLFGRITIDGYKPRRNVPVTIYSPKGFNYVVISPMPNKNPVKATLEKSANWKELNESFTCVQLDNIVANYDGKCDAIVLMQRNSGAQNMIHTFSKHMAENVFPVVNTTNRPYYASEYILNCLIQSADLRQTLQVPNEWKKLTLQPGSRWMVAGGKGVGKSTLLRYMLNRHLQRFERILFIDLDIGQPELFVPQTVSCTVLDGPLLGAGFFQNKQPDRAYVVGHLNVMYCVELYARAVRELLSYCKANKSYTEMPWLINTMGYNRGFGLELIVQLVDFVQPTDMIQITSDKAINNYEILLDCKSLAKVSPMIYTSDEFKLSGEPFNYKLHLLASAVPQIMSRERRWRMSAKDVRYANLLARLSSALHGNAKSLTDCQPMKANMDSLELVYLVSHAYTREEIKAGMEVNMVYLCKGGRDGKPKECFGIGVVRAIDYESNLLYLIPAMPHERLWQANCLVLGGDMYLPQGFFKEQGGGVTDTVPFVFIIEDNKSSKSIQQIYFRPPGFKRQPVGKNTRNTRNV